MILTGDAILHAMHSGDVVIDPFTEGHLGANSYDLTLNDQFLVYKTLPENASTADHEPYRPLDMKSDNPTMSLAIPENGLVLYPKEVYLGCTNERCGSDKYVCCLEGRSSVGRLGIQVHLTAGFGDLGFKSRWTLEISVIRPVRVYPNVRICQAIFYEARGTRTRIYNGKYVEQQGPVPSQMWRDFV